MYVAICAKTQNMVYAEDSNIDKSQEYVCPLCRQPVVYRHGEINAPHFAHRSGDDCDTFTSDMSEWHRQWQNKFPHKTREVVMTLETSEEEYNYLYRCSYNLRHHLNTNQYDFQHIDAFERYVMATQNNELTPKLIKHRADIRLYKNVIEFQHSPIPTNEFDERNWFYNACGYRVIWVFDMRDKVRDGQISYAKPTRNGEQYNWSHPMRIFEGFIPQGYKDNETNEYCHDGIELYFQLNNTTVSHVAWAILDNQNANYKRFICDDARTYTVDDFVRRAIRNALN